MLFLSPPNPPNVNQGSFAPRHFPKSEQICYKPYIGYSLYPLFDLSMKYNDVLLFPRREMSWVEIVKYVMEYQWKLHEFVQTIMEGVFKKTTDISIKNTYTKAKESKWT